jgi:antitoxin component HigA of HigAB toxin-antitoxin module
MDIKPIKTDADHEAALREIETLWGAAEGTADGDRLDELVTLVEAYEEERARRYWRGFRGDESRAWRSAEGGG